jgi:hypothetical protein
LRPEDFKRISPNMTALAGCDSDLKNNQNPLEGDFLWFSLRQDGFRAMGFGGSVGGLTSAGTDEEMGTMVAEVLEELHERAPFLKAAGYNAKTTVGGLSFAGDARIFNLLTRFQGNQIAIPTNRVLRRASLEIGAKAAGSHLLRSGP